MKFQIKNIKFLRLIIITLITIGIGLCLLIFILRLPLVQNFIKDKAIVYLEKKIKTKVSLQRVYVGFPNSLIVENLDMQDRTGARLLSVGKLEVGLDMWALIHSKAIVHKLELESVQANVLKKADGKFNFDYIIQAFATEDKKEEKSAPNFSISLNKIKLKDIALTFNDQQAGNNLKVYFNSFDTEVKTFDLDKNTYAVHDINLDGLKLRVKREVVEDIVRKVAPKVDSLNEKHPLNLGINTLNLTHFDIDYKDNHTNTAARIILKELHTKVNKIDLQQNLYDIDRVFLSGADMGLSLTIPAAAPKNQKTSTKSFEQPKALGLLLGKFVLEDVKLAYHNMGAPFAREGMDFNHLNFSKLNIDLQDFALENQEISGCIKSAEIKEKRGLNIQKLKTDFAYGSKEAHLRNLYLQTPQTVLQNEMAISYNSIEQLSANPGGINLSANFQHTKIGFADLLNLVPTLRNKPPFNQYPKAILNVNAMVKGHVNDLVIRNLKLSGLDQLKILASGRIKNIMNPQQLYYDLNMGEIAGSANTLLKLVPPKTLPSGISLPSHFNLKGHAQGNTKRLNTHFRLVSTLGKANITAQIDMHRKNHEVYHIQTNLDHLQVGKIINNKEVGTINGDISIIGEGFDVKRARAEVKGNMSAVTYKGYVYKGMNIKGELNKSHYHTVLQSKDPNAHFQLTASGTYNEKNPTIKLGGSIAKLDLHKLGFYETPMSIKGNIDASFSNLNPKHLNGYLGLQHFSLADRRGEVSIDRFNLEATSTSNYNQLKLRSQILDAEVEGQYKMTQILESLQQTINHYYQIQKPLHKVSTIESGQHFRFTAQIKDDELIRKFVPDLKHFETIMLNGSYSADLQQIEVKAHVPRLVYGEHTIESVSLNITNPNRVLQYQLDLASLESSGIALRKVKLTGDIGHNIIHYHITTQDEQDRVQYLLAGSITSLGDVTSISVDPDGLKLDYKNWMVTPHNKIEISRKAILASNFKLSHAGSELLLSSDKSAADHSLNMSLKDFKIQTFTEIFRKDSLLAKGSINGVIELRNLTRKPSFTSNLRITDLDVYGHPIGNVNMKVAQASSNVLTPDIVLSGNQNNVRMSGNYYISSGIFDLDMEIQKLQMKSLEAFSGKAIHHTEGGISGDLKIEGTTDRPVILGKIKFNQAGLAIEKTGSDFRNINDEVIFTKRGIVFDQFKIHDKEGNALILKGEVLTSDYRDYAFNLNIKAKDFKVVNSKKSKDAMIYGVLGIDAELRIRGDLDLPVVDGKLAVAKSTDFTFVLPQSSSSLQEREGIVEFVDPEQEKLHKSVKEDSLQVQGRVKGMDVHVNIETHKDAIMSILIDKGSGDLLKLQGEAELTGGISPSGKVTLVGVYEVNKGTYELSLSMLKRQFAIQKGSRITWTGEPTMGNMAITAIYKTEASPLDLVEQQLSGKSASQVNTYKQQIPFNTLLKMKGELLKPEISFDITTDKNNNKVSSEVMSDINTKLTQLRNDASDMNKQVFALLLLNRFIGETPFQSSAGVSAGTMARQSVSKILSQQLNSFAADLIKGVNLNFNLESSEDYSSGQKNTRTDLNVDINKKLLNDRLKVSVGSNFGLEGNARKNENMTHIAGDITVDYSLSKDGRYTLRAYRKNEYQVALQGQIIETGVGFVITLDYDEFKEIFQKSKDKRQK
ncbi:translocation/assembly module TamB [Elizabethkingia argentiflava]|uniref:Translocation/assembly module TamB n=1 Tax=Elizabethkingia argenteiflava TaxID=2681556 RepID=A0A845PYG0_9FLAO|nr:translocation/assembly module TamB [Elizabethkingia argenteiflava]NAW51120.1 translocation/assembly module TamB [Elizabethkingia argenteiflava]